MTQSRLSLVPTEPEGRSGSEGQEVVMVDPGANLTPAQSLVYTQLSGTFRDEGQINEAIATHLRLLQGETLVTDPRFKGSRGLEEATRVRDELMALKEIRRGLREQVNVAYA